LLGGTKNLLIKQMLKSLGCSQQVTRGFFMLEKLLDQFNARYKNQKSPMEFSVWYWKQRGIDSRKGTIVVQMKLLQQALEHLVQSNFDINKVKEQL